MTRVKYIKQPDGSYHSKEMLAIDKVVKVILYKETGTGYIFEIPEKINKVVIGATSYSKLTKAIKDELINRGVNFQPEVRPRFRRGKTNG